MQNITTILAGASLDRLTDSGMSFRFGHDGRVLVSSCVGPDGPVCAFGTKYHVSADGSVQIGNYGSDYYLVWEGIEVTGDVLSVRWEGRLLQFKFTPGKPRPKPYLP